MLGKIMISAYSLIRGLTVHHFYVKVFRPLRLSMGWVMTSPSYNCEYVLVWFDMSFYYVYLTDLIHEQFDMGL